MIITTAITIAIMIIPMIIRYQCRSRNRTSSAVSISPPSNQAKFLFPKSNFDDLDDVTFTFSNGNTLHHNHHHNHNHDRNNHHHYQGQHNHQDYSAWADDSNNKASNAHSTHLEPSKLSNPSPTETSRLTFNPRTGSNGKTLTPLNSSGGISTVDLLRRQSFLDLTNPQTRQGRYFFQQGLVRSPDYLTDRATPAARAIAALAVDSIRVDFSTNRSSASKEYHERNPQLSSLGSMGE